MLVRVRVRVCLYVRLDMCASVCMRESTYIGCTWSVQEAAL